MTAIRPIVLAAGGTGGHVFPAEALAGELEARGVPFALVTDRAAGSGRAPCRAGRSTTSHSAAARRGIAAAPPAWRRSRSGSACSTPGAALRPHRSGRRGRLRRLCLGADHARGPPAPARRRGPRAERRARPRQPLAGAACRASATVLRRAPAIVDDDRAPAGRQSGARRRCATLRSAAYRAPGARPRDRSAGVRRQPGRRVFSEVMPAAIAVAAGRCARGCASCSSAGPRTSSASARSTCRPTSWPSWRRSSPTAGAAGRRASGDRPLRRLDRGRAGDVGPAVDPGPLPYATDDHQTANARAFEAAGACLVIPHAELHRADAGRSPACAARGAAAPGRHGRRGARRRPPRRRGAARRSRRRADRRPHLPSGVAA